VQIEAFIFKFAHFQISKLITMAKAAKTAIKSKDARAAAEAKNWSKVIKAVRSPKTGAYTFKEAIVHKDKVKDFLAQK
jgi:hypothetical protein